MKLGKIAVAMSVAVKDVWVLLDLMQKAIISHIQIAIMPRLSCHDKPFSLHMAMNETTY
jgi:hypothetical protein